ncbi:LLM class flavin-dependent oxidoreductase [Mucilaginibacter phyllosphaerae]|nr:LLM class flavin-dependent oxidoreductase [Mucilaginibacter phyllosphaerae]MBB3968717.1 luciferase family oxidoreductase group 1 [Mucilaginibacter phyllosphaerae]GGH14311.1 monooxygenase [Mucilaginibacter phyllosphaerae]
MDYRSSPITLGILDTGFITPGKSAHEILTETWYCVQKAEAAGYTRYWLSEHHDTHYAWTRPALVIPYLGSATSHIRLGTAAILLGLYPALQIAEDYRVLEAIFPGRIDYGICSASPASDTMRHALVNGEKLTMAEISQRFEPKLKELHSYLHNEFAENDIFCKGATPVIKPGNTTWVMGTGKNSALLAAKNSCAFSYSLFHRFSLQDAEVPLAYGSSFLPGIGRTQALSNIAISVICAATHAEAMAQKEWIESVQSDFQINVFGDAQSCALQIAALCAKFKTTEVVVFMMWHLFEKKLAAIDLLAKAMNNQQINRSAVFA